MAIFLVALVAWIVISIIATPFIGRFLVIREEPEDQARAAKNGDSQIWQMNSPRRRP